MSNTKVKKVSKKALKGAKGKTNKIKTKKTDKGSKGPKGTPVKQRLVARRKIIKNPHSPWIFFTGQFRKIFQEKNPGKNFGEISHLMSNKWRLMSEEEKAPFQKQHEQDKLRFKREMEVMDPEKKKMLRIHRSRQKDKKKKQPKPGLSAYMFFVQSKRKELVEQHPELKFDEVGRQLGAMWRAYSEDEKAPFQKQSMDDKQRYLIEREAYNKAKEVEKMAAQRAKEEALAVSQ